MFLIQPCQQRHKLAFLPSRFDSPANNTFSLDWASNKHRNHQSAPQSQSASPPAAGSSSRHIVREHRRDPGNELVAQGFCPAAFVRRAEVFGVTIADQFVCSSQAAETELVRGRGRDFSGVTNY